MKKEDKAKLEQLESRIHRLEVIAEMLVRKVGLPDPNEAQGTPNYTDEMRAAILYNELLNDLSKYYGNEFRIEGD